MRAGDGVFACQILPLVANVNFTDEFNSNFPIGAVSFLLIFLLLRIDIASRKTKASIGTKLMSMDFPGIVLLIGAACCLLLALHYGGTSLSWSSPTVTGLFVGFGLLTVLFGAAQWRLGDTATILLRVLLQRSVFMRAWYLFLLEISIYVSLKKLSNSTPNKSAGSIMSSLLLSVSSRGLCNYEWCPSNTTWSCSNLCRHYKHLQF